MNSFRIRFGIMQCLLALLLLLDAPHPDFGLRNTAAVAAGATSDAVVLASQPPETVFKHETANSLCIVKRNDDHGPKAIGPAAPGIVGPPRLVVASQPAPPLLHVPRHRVLAAPPTGPPSA
jgi:hypothetical protein